ncbi:MAG: hypothetical protein ACP5VE_04945, partial [Chthonomonadales bacterium]
APRRDYNPPQRDYTPAPRRDYNPPQRDYTPAPRRDYNPPQRDYRGTPLGDRIFPGVRADQPRNQPATDRAPHMTQDPSSGNRGQRDLYDFRRGVPREGTSPEGRNPLSGRIEPGREGPTAGRVPGMTFGQNRPVSPGRQDRAPGREFERGPIHDRMSSIFGRTEEGRRYFSNGVILRPRTYIEDRRIRYYFPYGYVYYPYYAPVFEVGVVASPFYFYYGAFPAYIYRWHVYTYPPPVVYIEVPIYEGGRCRGWGDDDLDDYYLNSRRYRYEVPDSDLQRAIDDIRDAFRTGDVNPLVSVTDPSVKIAIFLKGKYEYSIAVNDYLDMTRDALNAADTITFDLYRVHRRAEGVYVVSGKHVYRNRDGEVHTVYVSYVLERINGRWVITQIGTAPDRIREP